MQIVVYGESCMLPPYVFQSTLLLMCVTNFTTGYNLVCPIPLRCCMYPCGFGQAEDNMRWFLGNPHELCELTPRVCSNVHAPCVRKSCQEQGSLLGDWRVAARLPITAICNVGWSTWCCWNKSHRRWERCKEVKSSNRVTSWKARCPRQACQGILDWISNTCATTIQDNDQKDRVPHSCDAYV